MYRQWCLANRFFWKALNKSFFNLFLKVKLSCDEFIVKVTQPNLLVTNQQWKRQSKWMKSVQRHQNDVIDVICCFYCWLWTSKCRLGRGVFRTPSNIYHQRRIHNPFNRLSWSVLENLIMTFFLQLVNNF